MTFSRCYSPHPPSVPMWTVTQPGTDQLLPIGEARLPPQLPIPMAYKSAIDLRLFSQHLRTPTVEPIDETGKPLHTT